MESVIKCCCSNNTGGSVVIISNQTRLQHRCCPESTQSISRVNLMTQPMAYSNSFSVLICFLFKIEAYFSLNNLMSPHPSSPHPSLMTTYGWDHLLRDQSLICLNADTWTPLPSNYAHTTIAMEVSLASLIEALLGQSLWLITHPNWWSRTIRL